MVVVMVVMVMVMMVVVMVMVVMVMVHLGHRVFCLPGDTFIEAWWPREQFLKIPFRNDLRPSYDNCCIVKW